MLEHAAPVGLFLLTLWTVRYRPSMLPVPIALVVFDVLIGLLAFNKSMVMLSALMFTLALLHNRATFSRMITSSIALVSLFILIEPVVGYGRTELSRNFAAIRSASFAQRMDILDKYITSGAADRAAEAGAEFQGSRVRISYVHVVAPAMEFYDRGTAGDSLYDALTILIPRALWPEKPIYDQAARFNEMINGSMTSASWMGYFGEGYWNLGWISLPLIMFPIGVMFFFYGRYALQILEQKQWLHFPSIFLGMFLGIRTDGSLVTEVFGTCAIALAYHAVALAGTKVLSAMGTHRAMQNGQTRNRPQRLKSGPHPNQIPLTALARHPDLQRRSSKHEAR